MLTDAGFALLALSAGSAEILAGLTGVTVPALSLLAAAPGLLKRAAFEDVALFVLGPG